MEIRRARRGHLALQVSMLMVAVAACTPGTFQPVTSPSQIDVWPTVEWRHATPESQGFDSVTLTEAIQAAADTRALHSLFVARSGYEIVDATAYPYDDSMYHDLASVTKSVLTTLLGIAVDRDELDPDASIVGFFPDHTISDRERKEEITVRHLAGMTTGLACSNIPDETELAQMQASSDFVEFALDLDVMTEPGSGFSYCSPGMHLLSAIIQQATGMSARDYAQVTLFDPLGIQEVHWPADAQGVTHGWGDLALHPEDAAKLGELFLHEGEWDGQRIVSSEWVAEATTGHMPTNLHEDYGYGWYVAPDGEEVDYFRADGNGGQRILVAPEFGLVMVTTGAGLAADDLLEAVYGAATDGGDPLPPNPTGADGLDALVDELATGPEAQPPAEPPAIAAEVSGRTYTFNENEVGLETLRLDLDQPNEARLTLDLASESAVRVDRVGLDGLFRPSLEGRPIVARGMWESPETFLIEIDEGPGVTSYTVELAFEGHQVTVEAVGASFTGTAQT